MSISHERDISISTTFQGGTTDEANDYVIIIESSTNTARIFQMGDGSQVGSNISVTSSPRSIAMIDSASAVIGTSGTTIDFLEIASATVGSISGGSGQSATVEGHKIATDPSNKTAVIVPSTARTLVFVNGNTFTATTTTMNVAANQTFSSVVYKSSNRYIAGTNRGRIYEIDSVGTVYDMVEIGYNPSPGTGELSSDISNVVIQYLAYQDGYLLMSTEDGVIFVMDWTTKEILHSHYMGSSGGITLSNAASGVAIMGRNRTQQSGAVNSFGEMDFTLDRSVASTEFTDSVGTILGIGINTTNGRGWAIQETIDRIRIFTVAPRESTTRTLETPNNQDARLIILDYTNGLYGAKRIVDTVTTSPRDFRVPTNKTLLEIIKMGEGTNATYSVSKYDT